MLKRSGWNHSHGDEKLDDRIRELENNRASNLLSKLILT